MHSLRQTRRQFCLTAGASLTALACGGGDSTGPVTLDGPRLAVRPTRPTTTITSGLYRLYTTPTSSLLRVPESYQVTSAMPLVVALHGAGATAQEPIDFLTPYAESQGFLVLAPESVGGTWDGVDGNYGPDVTTMDGALRLAFGSCNVDSTRICLEGFSDGASNALGVGISNPEVFTRVVAFSPGFITEAEQQTAKPDIFVSHGTRDGVLPIDTASRVIVPELRTAGYEVTYLEFDGTHTVPANVAGAAVAFMVAR